MPGWFTAIQASLQGTAARIAEQVPVVQTSLEGTAAHIAEQIPAVQASLTGTGARLSEQVPVVRGSLAGTAAHLTEMAAEIEDTIAREIQRLVEQNELMIGGDLSQINRAAIAGMIAAKATFEQLSGSLMDAGGKATQWALSNPEKAVLIALGLILIAQPGAVTGPVLTVLGFGPEGILPNSIAAAAQASMGDVMAGSVFSTLQSAAMAGYGTAAVNAVAQGAGVAAVGAIVGGEIERKSKL